MPAKLALMLEISREKKYTDGLKIFRSQELLPISLETGVQYGDGEITSTPYGCAVIWYSWTRFGPKTKKKSSPIYLGPKHVDTIFMQWMSVKLADNFQIREHSWPCLLQLSELILFKFFLLDFVPS
jgi:hypothetical protein